jgi:hypothetical protein
MLILRLNAANKQSRSLIMPHQILLFYLPIILLFSHIFFPTFFFSFLFFLLLYNFLFLIFVFSFAFFLYNSLSFFSLQMTPSLFLLIFIILPNLLVSSIFVLIFLSCLHHYSSTLSSPSLCWFSPLIFVGLCLVMWICIAQSLKWLFTNWETRIHFVERIGLLPPKHIQASPLGCLILL